MKKKLLIPFCFLFSTIAISQNSFNEANTLRINKSEESINPNCVFLDNNKSYDLPLEGAFLYSSFNNSSFLNPAGYSDNENNILTINNVYGRKIILKSQFFNTENSFDVLTIYDGEDTLSPLISSLSGVLANDFLIISTSNQLTLHFKSNQSTNSKGFRFRVDQGSSVNYKTGTPLPTPQSCAGTPASDECANAPLICNVNGYCGNTSGSYTSGNTSGLGSFCGSIENNSWIKFIASSSSATLNITSGGCQSSGSGIQAAMYATSNCSNYTQVSTCVSQGSGSGSFNISSNVNLVVGQAYYIMVDGYAGNVCNYTVTAQNGVSTSATQITSSQSQVCPGFTTSLASAVSASSANNYTWTSTPAGTYPNTQTITVSPSSTTVYTLTMGASPCSSVATVATKTIVVTNTLSPANITAPNLVCYGSDVNISSLTNGGTYIWTGPSGFTSSSQNNVIPSWAASNNGNYNLTINYGSGCTTTPTFVTINGVSPPVVTLTPSTATLCAGQSLTLTAGGGSGNNPYTWNWDFFNTTAMLQNCVFSVCTDNPFNSIIPEAFSAGPKGQFTVTATTQICAKNKNSAGCVGFACTNITVNTCSTTSCPTLTLSVASQSNVTCYGTNTGSATVSTAGGTGPYTYTWMPGNVTGSSQSSLAAGIYTVNTKDVNNCPGSFTLAISQPSAALAISLVGTSPASCGSANGSATISVSGGSPVYNYTWFPAGGSGTSASSLNAGTYTVGVIDSKGCFTISAISINSAGGPTLAIASQQNVKCFGTSTGSASISANGGSGTITYTWSPGNLSGSSQSALAAGIYNIIGADNSGCIGTTTLSITQPTSALTATVQSSNTSCGGNTGSATVTASGGTPNYNYSWSPSGGSSATATSLGAGTYSIIITDSKTCTTSVTANITSSGGATLSVSSQSNATCFGASDGSGTVSLSSGVGSYTWLPSGGNSSSASGLQAGTYTVIASASGCISFTTVTIGEPSQISITVNTTSSSCTAADGSATANAIGGSSTYTYTWSDGSTGSTLSNVLSGSYTVDVVDDNGCYGTAVAIVGKNNGGFSVDAGTGTTIEFGQSTTLNGIVPTGATYTWSPANTLSCSNCLTPIASPKQTTIFTLFGTDANGCLANDTVIILVNIPCGEVFVPTAFSPNKDGSNDELYVYGNCISELELIIYDRWGEKVFETIDTKHGWDGTYKGKDLNTAAFAYSLKAMVNGQLIQKKGTISLVR